MRAATRSSSTGAKMRRRRRPSSAARVIDDISIAELIDYIDWSPFFTTWELAGKFPAILDDKIVGEAARSLYDDAQKMLKEIVEQGLVQGRRRASASGRRIQSATTSQLFGDASRGKPIATLHTLRQQLSRREGRANVALADFVAPKGHADYIGAFVVTAGIGEDEVADRFKNANDDYSSIMVKALADRLGGGLRRAAAPAGAEGVLGLCRRRDA